MTQRRASKAGHTGKWRETMDSHFVRLVVEWGRREGFKKAMASGSQSKAKLCCSYQQTCSPGLQQYSRNWADWGVFSTVLSLLQAEATVHFCQFCCSQGGSPWKVACTHCIICKIRRMLTCCITLKSDESCSLLQLFISQLVFDS